MLGGIDPNKDSRGGAEAAGDWAPEGAFIMSSKDEPAGPGTG